MKKRKMIVLNSLRLVIFLVHLLTSRTVYSQQEEHVASEDLSAVYLKWEFEKDSRMSQTADIHNSSKIYENCDAFIYEFAKQASRFIDCSIVNARPFRFCEGCVEHYEKAKTVYNDIKLNDEKKTNCRKYLLDSDRVQVINTVNSDFEKIWNSADCDRCFNSISETDNGTVKYSLKQTTKDFLVLYSNFTSCLPKNATKHNETVCDKCAVYYEKMNSMFDNLLDDNTSPQHVCMDLVDMMNYTRLLWGKDLQCTKFQVDSAPVIVVGVILLLVPVFFYSCMKIYGGRKEKEIIRQKRLSVAERSHTFNFTGNNSGLENTIQNSFHHSDNIVGAPIRQRTTLQTDSMGENFQD